MVNEALLHGVPCVVSDRVGCAPDLVIANETGEIFRAEDENDLTRALEGAMKWMRAENVRAKCMQRAEMYSTRRAAEGIAQAFELAVGKT